MTRDGYWLITTFSAAVIGGLIGVQIGKPSNEDLPDSTAITDAPTKRGVAHSPVMSRDWDSADAQKFAATKQDTPPSSLSNDERVDTPSDANTTDQYDLSSDTKDALEETGQMILDASDASRQRREEEELFEEEFESENADWESQTQISDFLTLHEQSHLVDLQSLKCDDRRCQLIGQFDSQHEEWGEIVEQMSDQDWWEFTGTSSSSTTRDGKTYFVLTLTKP